MTPLGMRLRTARVQAGLSQTALGAECGISQPQISRIESGCVTPEPREVRLLARALEMDPADLGYGAAEAVRDTSAAGPGGSEDDVHRRTFLTGSIGVSTAAILPPTSSVASAMPTDWDKALYTSAPPTSSDLSTTQLNAGLSTVAHHLAAARYEEAETALPRLIAAAKAIAANGSKRGSELLSRAWVLATAIRVKERHPDAWSTSSWAVESARRSQHPLALAMAARGQYICLRQHGQHRQAQMVATTALSDLADEELARPVLGHLLLESAYGAAQAGQAADAGELWERGHALAQTGPPVAIWPDHPGPLSRAQVERYGVCIHHTLGDTQRAVSHMEKLNASSVSVPHTAARIRHDGAKLTRDIGDMAGALRLLQDLADETPQDAQRTSVRSMVAGMLRTSPALPGLRPFAASIGAV